MVKRQRTHKIVSVVRRLTVGPTGRSKLARDLNPESPDCQDLMSMLPWFKYYKVLIFTQTTTEFYLSTHYNLLFYLYGIYDHYYSFLAIIHIVYTYWNILSQIKHNEVPYCSPSGVLLQMIHTGTYLHSFLWPDHGGR